MRPIAIARSYAAFFVLAGALGALMLGTDTNLRTDFGAVSSGYFWHWYVILATVVADLLGAALLLVLPSRRTILGGFLGSALLVGVYLGAILAYQGAGFASAGDFAQYLFGVTYSGGDVRYLYDVLLGVDAAAWGYGGVALRRTRANPSSASTG